MDGLDEVDPHVGFLYKTMLQRDPKKRRVKPVQKHMLQLDFGGLDDSEDDSDFEIAPDRESDQGSGDSHEEDEESESDEDQSEEGSDDEQDDDEEPANKSFSEAESEAVTLLEEGPTFGDLLQRAKLEFNTETRGSEDGSASSRKLRVLICCVCLGDISEEDDEIVECDGCGVSVHEGCYGIAESQSVASTESSASTEPWFCDSCKAGLKPHCELCPNSGGIYKETDAGRWVHIVCALYVPGVAFGDVDKLSNVTLFEMPYSKWGAKECSLCEDARFSRTGVCIGCDAGMCRNYFHVTCAQREGLLSEASPDEEIADPFFAYCKQHADKAVVRAKRRNWLAVKSHLKQYKDADIDDEKEKRKLNRHRQKYTVAKLKRQPSWVPTEKMPRLLTSSPSAVKRLLKKAELLGLSTANDSNPKDMRKRPHVAPAFSVEYISYYLERNTKVSNLRNHIRESNQQASQLQEQETVLRLKYDQVMRDVETLRQTNKILREQGEKVWDILGDLTDKPIEVPQILCAQKLPKSPSRRDTPKSPPHVIHQCGICKKTNDQHQLAKCDKCKLFYHLGCLDPPLTRMPKKTKQQGWQCSECASSSSDESSGKGPHPDAPMKLREKIKEPVKFTPPVKEKKRMLKKGRKKKSGAKRKLVEDEEQTVTQPPKQPEEPVVVTIETTPPPPKKRVRPARSLQVPRLKPEVLHTECCVCNQPGTNSNLVRCDVCLLCYHFHCLDPPLRKSPKQRGYAWHCTACDPTNSDDDVSGGDEKVNPASDGEPYIIEITEEDSLAPPAKIKKKKSVDSKTSCKSENTGENLGKPAIKKEGSVPKMPPVKKTTSQDKKPKDIGEDITDAKAELSPTLKTKSKAASRELKQIPKLEEIKNEPSVGSKQPVAKDKPPVLVKAKPATAKGKAKKAAPAKGKGKPLAPTSEVAARPVKAKAAAKRKMVNPDEGKKTGPSVKKVATDKVSQEMKKAATEVKKVVAESKKAASEGKKLTADGKKALSEVRKVAPEGKKTVPEMKKSVPEVKKAVSDVKKSGPDGKKTGSDCKKTSSVPESKKTLKKSLPEGRKTAPDLKKTTPENKKSGVEAKKLDTEDEKMTDIKKALLESKKQTDEDKKIGPVMKKLATESKKTASSEGKKTLTEMKKAETKKVTPELKKTSTEPRNSQTDDKKSAAEGKRMSPSAAAPVKRPIKDSSPTRKAALSPDRLKPKQGVIEKNAAALIQDFTPAKVKKKEQVSPPKCPKTAPGHALSKLSTALQKGKLSKLAKAVETAVSVVEKATSDSKQLSPPAVPPSESNKRRSRKLANPVKKVKSDSDPLSPPKGSTELPTRVQSRESKMETKKDQTTDQVKEVGKKNPSLSHCQSAGVKGTDKETNVKDEGKVASAFKDTSKPEISPPKESSALPKPDKIHVTQDTEKHTDRGTISDAGKAKSSIAAADTYISSRANKKQESDIIVKEETIEISDSEAHFEMTKFAQNKKLETKKLTTQIPEEQTRDNQTDKKHQGSSEAGNDSAAPVLESGGGVLKPLTHVDRFREQYMPQYEDISDAESGEHLCPSQAAGTTQNS